MRFISTRLADLSRHCFCIKSRHQLLRMTNTIVTVHCKPTYQFHTVVTVNDHHNCLVFPGLGITSIYRL